MVFQDSTPNEKLSLSWDGSEEILSPTSGKFDYVHAFQIPWYASGTFVLGLGVLIAISLALALTILLWEKRTILIGNIEEFRCIRLKSRLSFKDVGWISAITLLALLLRLPKLGGLFPQSMSTII